MSLYYFINQIDSARQRDLLLKHPRKAGSTHPKTARELVTLSRHFGPERQATKSGSSVRPGTGGERAERISHRTAYRRADGKNQRAKATRQLSTSIAVSTGQAAGELHVVRTYAASVFRGRVAMRMRG